MILVDVVFPELNRVLDFQVDENIRGWEIADEIATMAGRNSGREFDVAASVIQLYAVEAKKLLNLELSLKENGINSGDQLLFI